MNRLNRIRVFLSCALVMAISIGVLSGKTTHNIEEPKEPNVPGALFSSDRVSNTAAVSTVSGLDLYKNPAVNVTNSMAGLLPGLTLMQGSGSPDNDDARWLIRGIGSHGLSGYNRAKIFVDGFEVNNDYLTSLIPAEIESLSILKDGAALTLFGDRGANGVIWVETKRGVKGKNTITARVRSGLQSASTINKPLNSADYAYNYNLAISNDKKEWSPVYSNAQIEAYRNNQGIDVDWYDEALKDFGHYVDTDVTLNGGGEFIKYNVVLGYLNQQGLLGVTNNKDRTSNLTFARYNLRANFDFKLNEIFEAKIDLGGKIYDHNRPMYSPQNLMYDLATYPNNIYNIFDDQENTRYSGSAVHPNNPIGSIKGVGYRREHNRILQGNFTVKENLDMVLEGLYLYQSFSIYSHTSSSQNKSANYARYKDGVPQTTDKDESISAGGWGSDGMQDWKQGKIGAGYDQVWGSHALRMSAEAHVSSYKGDGFFSRKYNYLNYRGRANYVYDDRFVAELGLSVFGNDAYHKDNRWSTYPAVSGAWILSNENFMSDSKAVDHLKIRASFGISGSSDSEATGSLSGFSSNGRFLDKEYYGTNNPFGGFYTGDAEGNWQTTLVPIFLANKDAKPEKSYKYNLGVDASLFNNKLTVMADVYYDKRTDILTLNNSLMNYYGGNYFLSNIGEMTNRGFELMATYRNQSGDWTYAFSGMVSYNHNKIKNMDETPTRHSYNAYTGRPYGTIIGLEADGFYQVDDFENGILKDGIPIPAFGDVQPGDIRYRDLDNDGVVDDDDVKKIGESPFPEWTYSMAATIGFKGFDLSILMQGVAGGTVDMLAANNEQTVPFVNNRTIYKMADNSWVYYPEQGIDNRTEATFPRLSAQNNENNYRTSSFWLEDLNFLKIRHIELGYNFKLQNSGISNLRVYFNAANPFTFSKLYSKYDIDPEQIGYGYPMLRTYTLGVALTF